MTDVSNIVDFMARLRQSRGAAAFMICPACECEDLAVVIRWLGRQPYIAALACTSCEAEIGVHNGMPVGWR